MSEQLGTCRRCGGSCNPKRGGRPGITHANSQICIASLKHDLAQAQAALERVEGERDRYREALEHIIAIRPEKPRLDDFSRDDIGARSHARAMAQWQATLIAQEAIAAGAARESGEG